MNDYLEWLAAGLIFLLVLGTYDARATPVDRGSIRFETSSQDASLAVLPFPELHVPTAFVRLQPPAPATWSADGTMATAASKPGTRSRMMDIRT